MCQAGLLAKAYMGGLTWHRRWWSLFMEILGLSINWRENKEC